MGADTLTVAGLLKEDYAQGVGEAVASTSNVDTLLSRVKRSAVGSRVVIDVHTSRNSGVGFGAENGNAPPAGNQGYEQIPVTVKKVWGSFRVTAKLLALATSDRGAFDNVAQREMKGLAKDFINVKDKYGTKNGDGSLATVGAQGPTNTLTLDDARDVIYFEEGMSLDLYDVVAGAFVAGGTAVSIVSTDLVAGTITINGAGVTIINAGTFVTLAGVISDGTANFDNLPIGTSIAANGLDSAINTTTLFGVNPVNVPKYSALDGNGLFSLGTDFTEQNVELLLDKMTTEGATTIPDLFLTSKTQIRQYQTQLRKERRQPSTLMLKSGREALSQVYEGKKVALVGDRFIKNGYSYAWMQDELTQYVAQEMEWWAPNGGVLLQVPRKTAQEGILYQLYEIAPRVRNGMLRKTDWNKIG